MKGLNSVIMWKFCEILPSSGFLRKDFVPPWCSHRFFGELRCDRLEMASRSGSQKSKSGSHAEGTIKGSKLLYLGNYLGNILCLLVKWPFNQRKLEN